MLNISRAIKESLCVLATVLAFSSAAHASSDVQPPIGSEELKYNSSFGSSQLELKADLVSYLGGDGVILKIGEPTRKLINTYVRAAEYLEEEEFTPYEIAKMVSMIAWDRYKYGSNRAKMDGEWKEPYRVWLFDFCLPTELSDMLESGESVCYEKAIFTAHTLDRISAFDDYEVLLGSFKIFNHNTITDSTVASPEVEDIVAIESEPSTVYHKATLLVDSKGDTFVVDHGNRPEKLSSYIDSNYFFVTKSDSTKNFCFKRKELRFTTPLEELEHF
ncbi:MAG: hypothetical protein KKH88_00310 [Nanoarchaeota archaeon]|nr:hypothetical protein [Nanoarchaeota archaeon]